MAKPLRNIVEKVQTDPAPKAPKEGQFSGKRSTTEAPPSIDKDNFYNWEGGEDGVKFIKKHQTSRRNYPYDADAAFTSGKVGTAAFKKQSNSVYESKRMKCESCGSMYEGEACGCGSSSDNNKKGKKLLLGGKKPQEVQERHMTSREKAKEERIKKKVDPSEMKASMKKQYGPEEVKNIYFHEEKTLKSKIKFYV